ncbi:unnamed protein product [Amoebophrya sp. A120]|nr:unnamed protein product [Amoebophrya sp. A120]|eukprot:GSA120T00020709001.1
MPFFLPPEFDQLLNYIRQTVLLKLVFCLLLDLFGVASFLLPGFGELADISYAPVQAYLLYRLFNNSFRIAALGFAEEILPGTDVLPTATLAWVLENTSLLPEQLNLLLGVIRNASSARRNQ